MGHEMAFNLFSKRFAEDNDTEFVVCDVVPKFTIKFHERFTTQFPGAKVAIATTPEEWVFP